MKRNRKIITFIMTLIMVMNGFIAASIPTFAHGAMLNVRYDECIGVVGSDSIDEEWYTITATTISYHISHEVDTIKYYFAVNPESEGDTEEEKFGWTDLSEEFAEEIQTAVVNSMKKWANVYFYSYNPDGSITKNKVINIVEGTEQDHNLLIYPETGKKRIGAAYWGGSKNTVESGTVTHAHFSEWYIWVNVDYFDHNKQSYSTINMVKERLGAHEFGHVLGLYDVDNCCSATNTNSAHHEEILMGYGSNRSTDIKYKDIAGVAITRGFHTDEDHRWLTTGALYDGEYKLICSICNGVKYVDNLADYPHDMYMYCELDHELSDGNMMAVASYGNKDYYKCKYCKYVAPFSEIVEQNYEITPYSNDCHKYENTVDGLEYTFYKPHAYIGWMYFNNASHRKMCSCGHVETQTHYIRASDIVNGRYATCWDVTIR